MTIMLAVPVVAGAAVFITFKVLPLKLALILSFGDGLRITLYGCVPPDKITGIVVPVAAPAVKVTLDGFAVSVGGVDEFAGMMAEADETMSPVFADTWRNRDEVVCDTV